MTRRSIVEKLNIKRDLKMDKQMYKELVAEHMKRNAKLKEKNLELEQKIQDYYFDIRNKNLEIHVLKEENTKLRMALCNLRDEYLDMGGDPNQLELFDKNDPSQLNIFESPDGGKTIYQRKAGSSERIKISE